MEKYIGFEVLTAEPMTRGAYNEFRGWTVPQDENPEDQGFKVNREDGHVSWFPKITFDNMYRSTEGMTFGLAVEAMKKGQRVARVGWNGSGMWAVIQRAYPEGIAINRNTAEATGITEGTVMKFRPYMVLFTAQHDFAHWVPSGSDILAEDWVIVE